MAINIPYVMLQTASQTQALSLLAGAGISLAQDLTAKTLTIVAAAGGGSPLTETDDVNVTCVLGGTPATALLQPVSLTFGWAGKLGLARGGTNADLSATGGASQVVRQSSAGAAFTVSQLAAADLSNGTTGTGAVALASNPAFLGSPTAPTQSVTDNSTKIASTAYVTTAVANAIAAVNPAAAVQAATAAILPNTPTYLNGVAGIGATITAGVTNVALVVDGYTALLGDRLLVKNESGGGGLGASRNGVYTVTTVAALAVAWVLTRALDFDQPSNINNTGAIPVVNGTANTQTQWVVTSAVATIGTDAITFTQFSLNPTTIVVTSGSYADPAWITSLAATKLTGTIADARLSANVALLNAANTFTARQTLGAGADLLFTGNIVPTTAGQVGYSGAYGMYTYGKTGSTDDWAVFAASGSYVMHVPTGTANLSVAGVLTVSGFGTHTVSTGAAGSNSLMVANTTSGTANYAYLGATAGTTNIYIEAFSQAWTTAGLNVQAGATIETGGVGGLSLVTTNASGALRLGTNSLLRWGINAAGDWTQGASSNIADSAGVPTILSGFGTGPTIAGNDYAFVITEGTGDNTGGSVTFGHTWTNPPICVASQSNTSIPVAMGVRTTTTTAIFENASSPGTGLLILVLCRSY